MSLLSRLLERGGPERRAFTPTAIPKNSDGFMSDSGMYVSEGSALQLAAVYACVQLIADSIASLPMDVFRKREAVREEVAPVPALIRQPFAHLTAFEWVFQTVTSLALRGNSFARVIEWDRFEFPVQLQPIHPDCVTIELDDHGRPNYRIDGVKVARDEIVHIRRFALPGAVMGLSPIEQARVGLGLGLAAERYGARYFRDSANPSSVLETDDNLSDEAAQATMRQWIASHGGRRRPAVLSGGLKYRTISVTPEESQFLETRKYQRAEIAMLFRVPPHMIGDTEKSTSWGTGIEQQSIGFVTYTLRPWLTCIEAALTDLLPRGQFVRFNVDALLRGDQKARWESYQIARNAGVLSVNEIRALEDMPPIPNGDSRIQPLNMGPLGSDPLAAKAEPTKEEPSAALEG